MSFSRTAIIQRVLSASVTVDKEVISSIGRGVLVFAAVAPGDSEKEAQQIANKVIKMKLWDDDNGGRVSSIIDFCVTMPYQCSIFMLLLTGFIVEEERYGHQRRSAMRYVALQMPRGGKLAFMTGF